MLYRTFPKVKDKLSTLGFGCMRLPVLDNDPTKIDEAKAGEMLVYAINNGVNYIDTAFPYHGTGMLEPGMSEPFVGKVLKKGFRNKVKLATKLPSWLVQSRTDMDRFLDLQLQRLQTDFIDFYLIHSLNKELWQSMVDKGVADFLDSAIADGRIKHAGFSFHDNSKILFKEIVDAYDWTFCQIQYNYLDEDYQAGREGLEYAVSKGLGIVVMEPLRGGSLATNLPLEAETAFRNSNSERTAVDWALRWLWNQQDVSVVLSGMSDITQVTENIKTAADFGVKTLSVSELDTVGRVKAILQNKVRVGCTACGYCMPCPVGVDIPQNFKYLNDFYRFDDAQNKRHSMIMYNRLLDEKQKAPACVECGQCEDHCPQGISISEKLKEVDSTLAMSF